MKTLIRIMLILLLLVYVGIATFFIRDQDISYVIQKTHIDSKTPYISVGGITGKEGEND